MHIEKPRWFKVTIKGTFTFLTCIDWDDDIEDFCAGLSHTTNSSTTYEEVKPQLSLYYHG